MSKLIFALDFDRLEEAAEWVELLKNEIKIFKIGLQLFTRYGPEALKMLQKQGVDIFLDLKIHDIPSISSKAVEFAADRGCYSTTLHVQAGEAALRRALSSKKKSLPRIWGVTVLSSSNKGNSLQPAKIASDCGLDGVVVSGEDLKKVKDSFPHLECVVPGIRPSSYKGRDDQKRVLTPAEAVKRGADYLVLGRAIRNAPNPIETLKEIKKDVENAN